MLPDTTPCVNGSCAPPLRPRRRGVGELALARSLDLGDTGADVLRAEVGVAHGHRQGRMTQDLLQDLEAPSAMTYQEAKWCRVSWKCKSSILAASTAFSKTGADATSRPDSSLSRGPGSPARTS